LRFECGDTTVSRTIWRRILRASVRWTGDSSGTFKRNQGVVHSHAAFRSPLLGQLCSRLWHFWEGAISAFGSSFAIGFRPSAFNLMAKFADDLFQVLNRRHLMSDWCWKFSGYAIARDPDRFSMFLSVYSTTALRWSSHSRRPIFGASGAVRKRSSTAER